MENQENGNRKRKSDYSDNSNNRKRSNNDDGYQHNGYNHGDLHLKLLVPSALAGSIIGRGGERISQLQKDTECRVKMSKANEFYPNTNERICLVIGSVKQVLKAHEIILERMQEKTEAARPNELEVAETRLAQIKLVIPKNTAGLIIGRSGAIIKQIKDESGAFVQISSKDTDMPERVLTVEGELAKRSKAFELIAQKIADDPLHSSIPTLSYSSGGGGGDNRNDYNDNYQGMSNSQGGNMMQQQQQQQQSMASNTSNNFNSAAYYLAGVNNLALLIINCGGSFQMTPEALKNALRSSNFNSGAILDIIDSITVLMNYGLITKIPPATILSSNPALAQFANMSFGGPGANFSGLTSILAASMAASIGMQNALTGGPGAGGPSNGMMGGPGAPGMMMNPGFDYENGGMHGQSPIQQQIQPSHHQQQQHHMNQGGNPYQNHQQRKVNKR